MKLSARVAYLSILLFFLFFNGLQAYLVSGRIEEAKRKFNLTFSGSLMAALSEYHKLKAIDSASMPNHGRIGYAVKKINVSRLDSQSVTLSSASSLLMDTVEAAVIESIVNSPAFRTIDMPLFDRLFKKALHAKKVNADYHLDTIIVARKFIRQLLPKKWEEKKRSGYYSVFPARLPYSSPSFVYVDYKYDPAFFWNELLWPMLAFAFILLIGNTALVFVYRTIRKQKRINELKNDFINNITHEMKTPITIASAGLEALQRYITPAERTSFYLQTSIKQLRLLNDFVERILEAAVQDIADLTLKKEKTDLHALLGEIIQSHSVIRTKPVTFRLSAEGPFFVNADRLHLQTAFHNIIDNAIKYSHGSVDINIDIVENNRDCIIKIRDNGMGIPPQFLKNIFEKFFRVPQGDAQSIKGFGLGLHYVNSIVKKHSGSISVDSKERSGTEFIITLPKY